MVSDSPYHVSELVLTPPAGMLAGLTGSVLMMGTVAALQRVSNLELMHLLAQIGNVFPITADPQGVAYVGVAVVLLVGALLGLLYAASQRRVPTRGLIAVGIFYGFVIWVVGSLIVGTIFSETLRSTLRSWPWLAACLVYGLCLAAASIVVVRRHPSSVILVPKD